MYIKLISSLMTSAKENWEWLIGVMVLLFTTYTITKDLVDEGTWPFLNGSKAYSAIIYAMGLILLVVVGFCIYINCPKRQEKIK